MAERKTIGISMRVVEASDYEEPRDALAHDWYPFLDWVLGERANWLLIPNLGAESVNAFVRGHAIDGLILSGGNDIGDCPIRDETETALIRYMLENDLPLVGICRGLQLIWRFFGGELKPVSPEAHIACRHQIYPTDEWEAIVGNTEPLSVNSYHGIGLSTVSRPESLITLAITDDQQIEAVRHHQAPILGLMWHPEREQPFAENDRRLIQNFLLGEQD
ncbi:gamma-glutamyl-gamma-aminobutyrate hydrolase family protein [Methylophaga sp.]|jgi:putative glutamine amidotransferase|uniref:gamma-glutamyl-gamma-aminobutyrate hydrolase family protein n=1 Tax=Methylophaga sp. TaxID=2024840 RepID=UPI0014011714|nr:gamma-glutamyl-gamma-aminobutyrate hydrolase family protein [Methylophaga sp.]MTI63753.1 glutamine amidotransferase [Methylophaga sp.]